uniref:Variant surface glycoprotein 1125.4103 n=1 Tax=Trypanosoma brucei TaxID=5691 RepID=A0A1J0RA93_9TRYP|nr:variant surface glycoprotein 1125.4103 [Trypanosoma brucei]
MMQTIPLPLFLTLLAAKSVSCTAGGGIKYTAWTGACQLAAELEKIQQKAAAIVKGDATTAHEELKQLYKAKIIIQKACDGSQTPEQEALLAYYTYRVQHAMAELSGQPTANQMTAIRDAARAQAAITEFVTSTSQIAGDDTHSCLEAKGGGNAFRKHDTALAADAPGCVLETAALTAAEPTVTGFDTAGYQGAIKSDDNDVAATGGGSVCSLTKEKATDNMLNAGAGHNIGGRPKFAAGIFYLDSTGMKMKGTAKIATKAGAEPLLHAAYQAYLATNKQPQKYEFKDGLKLKDDATFVSLYRTIVLKETTGSHAPESTIKQKIEAMLGGATVMSEKYDGSKTKEQVQDPDADEGKEIALSSISSLETLQKVLTYYKKRNIQKLKLHITNLENKANQQTTKINETDDTCAAKGTGDNCKPPCKVVGEGEAAKCKLEKESKQKAEKEAKSQAGENGKTDSNRCTKHSKKEFEPENKDVKSGKRAVCGWIGDKFKDYSFLLNNKFAPSITADFVALLF